MVPASRGNTPFISNEIIRLCCSVQVLRFRPQFTDLRRNIFRFSLKYLPCSMKDFNDTRMWHIKMSMVSDPDHVCKINLSPGRFWCDVLISLCLNFFLYLRTGTWTFRACIWCANFSNMDLLNFVSLLLKIFLAVGMYFHYCIENPYVGSLSAHAHTPHSKLLFTDKYTMYFPIFTPLHVWLTLPVMASTPPSLVNSYFSFKVQGKYHFPEKPSLVPIIISNSISHHKFMLGPSDLHKRNQF